MRSAKSTDVKKRRLLNEVRWHEERCRAFRKEAPARERLAKMMFKALLRDGKMNEAELLKSLSVTTRSRRR